MAATERAILIASDHAGFELKAKLGAELKALGARIEERPDGFEIDGPCELIGARVSSPPGDHRIAMTLAVAGLIASGETTVENADAVASSFPDFAATLESLRVD